MTAQSPTESDRSSASTDGAVPPGPDGYPVLGNTVDIMRRPLAFLDELRTYGDVVRYDLLGDTVTALLHPDHVERVLVEEPERFERYLFAEQGFDFAPEGILFTNGEQWRHQRRLFQSGFTMDRIRSYADTMSAYAAEAAAEWEDGQEVVLNDRFSTLTLRILAAALFDVEVDPDGEDEAIVSAARIINERSDSNSYAAVVPNWVPTPGNRRYKRALEEYRRRVDTLIERRRGEGDDLLSILLDADDDLSEAELRDNLITFTFAGHETSSLALTYTVLLLAQHEEIRAALDAELDAVLDGERPRFEHVPRLERTERVLTEAMRLYPPAYIMFRTPTEDVRLDGYELPEGSIVTLPQYAIHRDERFYDDPGAFRPDRWTDDADRPEYAYFPFGGGPRHCIGMRFAMLELKLVLATLAQRFEFEVLSDPDPELNPGATLQPAADVRVRVHERADR